MNKRIAYLILAASVAVTVFTGSSSYAQPTVKVYPGGEQSSAEGATTVEVKKPAEPVDPCALGQPRTEVTHDLSGEPETLVISNVKTKCLKVIANVYDDGAVQPESSYDPNKDNALLGMMEDVVDGVNNLEGRVEKLEARKPVPGPRGPKGDKGEGAFRFHVGPSIATMIGLAEGLKPTVGGGVAAEFGGEKVWAAYHGYLGSDGEGGGIGTNVHNSLAVMMRCGSDNFSCGIGAVDSRFLYFREKEGNAQRTDLHYMGAGPQFQVHLSDQLRLGFSGAYGLASRETPEMVVKASVVELGINLSIMLK